MEFEKPTEAFNEFFKSVAPSGPDVVYKMMFGHPACFVNGNMFTGLHGSWMILRLGDGKRQQFAAETGAATFEPMPGRPMKEYAVIPQAVLDDGATLAFWLAEALEFGRSLPPKEKKPKKSSF